MQDSNINAHCFHLLVFYYFQQLSNNLRHADYKLNKEHAFHLNLSNRNIFHNDQQDRALIDVRNITVWFEIMAFAELEKLVTS